MKCLALWIVIVASVEPAAAQSITATTGAVNGVLTDTSKAVVPGVTVNLSGPALITVQTTATDDAGVYRFSAVPPGDYAMTFALSGFATVVREGVSVGLGFTASVDVELRPGGVSESVLVIGSPVIDLASTEVTAHFDSDKLTALPGARDVFAVLANTPGVAVAKMDVGGNGALAVQEYAAYGLRATSGVSRYEVEGLRTGQANGINDIYLPDLASFAEVAVKAVGHSAAIPVPGTLVQHISKSGGNVFRGSAYADFQSDAWEATNIDDDQIARGVSGGPGLDARDVNRLQRFRDFTADAGGYLKKDKAWWYAAYRDTDVRQRYAWLLDTSGTLLARVGTGKVTYDLTPRQKLVGYLQHETFEQSSWFQAGANQPLQTSDALPSLAFPVTLWKGEYNAAVTDAFYVEARIGRYLAATPLTPKSLDPRIADVGANTVRGGGTATDRRISRPQANGSLSVTKDGWRGSHTFRIGGEYMLEHVDFHFLGYGNPCNCVSTLNNRVPAQVQIALGRNVSSNDLVTAAGFVDDTWRIHRRLTLSLGVRLDRYQPALPQQEGPTGQTFAAIDPVLTFNNWAPRLGMSIDLTGDGRTVLKLYYGRFWLYPAAAFTTAFNPNPPGWTRTHLWTNDANGNGQWDPGEEGSAISVSGGSASTRLDPDIVNTQVHQTTFYVEREIAADVTVRTGVVVNARRDPYGTFNVSRPLSAYTVPIAVVDPGPDGRPGSADDGATVTAYDLTPESLVVPPVNVTTNLPDSDSDYYTWEITATKRQSARWSLLASFTNTWNREAALGTGNDFTPNALVNATDRQLRFTTWQAKLYATINLPLDVRVIPIVRSQSGTPFARTFVRTLGYGNATIKAEPIDANRTPDITLFDLRTEKAFRIARTRVMGFVDVYNIFNNNGDQLLTTSSGTAWLRPNTITGPRIVRIGARLEW
jgi:hypothetical protein